MGGNCFKIDKKLTSKIQADYMRKPSQSVIEMSLKYKKLASFIQKLKTKLNLKTFKAVKNPDRVEKQHIKAKSRARKLYMKFEQKVMYVLSWTTKRMSTRTFNKCQESYFMFPKSVEVFCNI